MIKTWKIQANNTTGLSTLYIIGKNADEALSQARQINPEYNSVQLYSQEELDND